MSKSDDAYKKKTKTFNGIVKLASLLQKALDSGRSNYVEMSEVSRYVNYYIKTQIDDSTMYMDYILNTYRDDSSFKRLRNDLVTLFKELNDATSNGYEKLVAPNGSVNRDMLEELIEVDGEITSAMNLIRNALMAAKNAGELSDGDLKEIHTVTDELGKNIGERKSIVK
jgi:hypothetical protein